MIWHEYNTLFLSIYQCTVIVTNAVYYDHYLPFQINIINWSVRDWTISYIPKKIPVIECDKIHGPGHFISFKYPSLTQTHSYCCWLWRYEDTIFVFNNTARRFEYSLLTWLRLLGIFKWRLIRIIPTCPNKLSYPTKKGLPSISSKSFTLKTPFKCDSRVFSKFSRIFLVLKPTFVCKKLTYSISTL